MTPTIKTADNGITPETLAVAGYSVFMTCHGAPLDWSGEKTDRLTWEMTASNAIMVISEAKASETDLPIINLTMMIQQWMCEGLPFTELNARDRLVWIAVARLWSSLVCAEGSIDLPAVAKFTVEWFEGQLIKVEAPNVLNGAAQQQHGKNGQRFTMPESVNGTKPLAEVPKAVPSVQASGNGMARSFHRLIDLKIAEHKRKITALSNLKQKIGSDCDEALYEIIAPLLEKEG